MKSKIQTNQILRKGMAILIAIITLVTPIAYATTSLDDSYLDSTFWEQVLYGKVGSTVREIEEWFESGETDLYIRNETQLRALAEYVNNGNTCSGKRIILMNDIEVDSTKEWIPIGSSQKSLETEKQKSFKGIFDGKGYTISGINFNRGDKVYSELKDIGLFGYAVYADIKNVVISNSKFDIPFDVSGDILDVSNDLNESSYKYECLGAIAGMTYSSTISNCIVEDSVYINGLHHVGGIVGYNNKSDIKNCKSYAAIYGFESVGGIAGANTGAINNLNGTINYTEEDPREHKYGRVISCVNEGTVHGDNKNVGGIAGNSGRDSIVQSCENKGMVTIATEQIKINVNGRIITEEPQNVGGIVGCLSGQYEGTSKGYATVDGCINNGKVRGYRDAGGIVGQLGSFSGGYSIFTNNINYSTNVNAAYGNNEAGYLAGEVGGFGRDEKEGTADDPYVYMANNLYFIDLEKYKESYENIDTGIIPEVLFPDVKEFVPFILAYSYDHDKNNISYDKAILGYGLAYEGYYSEGSSIQENNSADIIYFVQDSYKAIYNTKSQTENGTTADKLDGVINRYKLIVTDSSKNSDLTIGAVKINLSNENAFVVSDKNKLVIKNIVVEENTGVDNTAPLVSTKVYVENSLESGRYTAGKEIILKVTTNEAIKGTYTLPEIQVSFSKSGIGKYNYDEKNKKAGYAKCIDAKINLDGTTSWMYSYQVQEGDEGEVEFTFVKGDIEDLAGNKTNIVELHRLSTNVSNPIAGTEWNSDLNVTYKFYKNSVSTENEVTSQTYFTGDDDLIVVAVYDKVLYVHYGLSDGKNTNARLTNNYKDRAPSLYLNGDNALKQSSIVSVSTTDYVESTSASGTTTVTYKFENLAKDYGLTVLTQVTKMVLKNENNGSTVSINGTTASTNGLIPYAEKWYSTYLSEQESTYNKTLTSGKIKTVANLQGIIIDPIGVTKRIEKANIYADTAVPTVEITAKKIVNTTKSNISNNITNADTLEYRFTWSEEIVGFGTEDITIINGTKGTLSDPIKNANETYSYTMNVTTNRAKGELKVIIEANACQDKVGLANIRNESIIVIDKENPTVEVRANKDKASVSEKVIYEFTWSEAVTGFEISDITVNNGTKGAFSGSGSYYTLEVTPNGANDLEVLVPTDKVKDVAGNNNIESEKHVIAVLPTVIIKTDVTNPTNLSKITYTFEWSEAVTGFDISDVILPNGITGELSGNKMTIDYNSLVALGNEGEVTVAVKEKAVQDANGNTNAYVSNTTKIDRIAPIFIGLESYAESGIKLNSNVDNVKQYYKSGDKVKIVATFTENIEKSTAPALALQFSKSGNAKGTVGEAVKEGNKISYTYTITSGDMGELVVKGFSGEVVDTADNKTKVTKRALDGNTIIADTIVPKLNELKVVSPSEGIYNAGDPIRIEAIYDEEIYSLINNEVNNMISKNAPTLKLKFGNGTEREATATGYDSNENKTKLVYTYTIVEGDNGKLSITSYKNKENVKVSDIAGNEVALNVNQKGNTINADTVRPEVTNITAEVENPTISNTGIYHKAGNEIKITVNFTEDVSAAKIWSRILIGFSEDENTEPTEYKEILDLNDTSRVREYSYTIKDGDNGYLWVKVEEGHFDDEAGNTNIAEEATKIETVFADTTKPTLTIYKDTETIQNGQILTVNATFSENIYGLSDKSRDNDLATIKAPIIIYGFAGATGNLEEKAYSVGEKVITYRIEKENTVSGEFYHAYFRGNVYDRAGNECFTNDNLDTIAPVLESVVISSNSGIYSPYCKEGREIYVTATFDEPIKAGNMKLKVKVGEVELSELLEGNIVEENERQVKFTYIVKHGDMGEFKILDICGEADNDITEENADKTYGWVEDQHGNRNKIYNLSEEGVVATGEAEADTKDPYITSIKAIANGKEVAIYTKEEGKDAVITVGRTNANIVEYIVTYNEKVQYNYFDKISITNGEIKSVEYTNSAMNEYKVTVQTTVEGVQSLMINEGTVEDKAGNFDGFVRLDAVTVDFTKPTVRFISEYNGGVYVLPKNIDKVEIRPNIEISEDITKIEYKWDDGEYTVIENYSSSSDIAVPTKAFTESGEYVLNIKVEDLAGNITEANKTYKVVKSNISIDLSTNFYTNQDITATVTFEAGLTDNRKVTFKEEGSDEVKELKAGNVDENGGIQYRIETNGIIYVEATDRVGNKVFTEEEVLNIDKNAPEITFSEIPSNVLKGEPLDITIYTNEYVLISYSWDNENWEEPQKYLTTVDITKSFEEVGEYTLYVKAKDKAGNESTNQLNIDVINLDFEVLGNTKDWTSQDVDLYVEYEGELASITVNEIAIDEEKRVYVAKENGEYVFVITDKYGNTATKTEKVEKVDKVAPLISKVENVGKEITITSTDEGSGIAEYAISKTTEIPAEWSESKVIKVTEDGTFYVWVKDNVGNITRAEEAVVVDTTAPTITFNYLSQTITVGMPLEANIVTNEEAIISYSWDKENWVNSEELISSMNVSKKSTTLGTYILYAKAKDKVGNESKIQTLEFTVTNIEEIKQPEIIFEDIPTIQVNGERYVKVPSTMTTKMLTDSMNKEALCGETPEYSNLTENNTLKTGTQITLNGKIKYIVVVNGDVNCDGKVSPIDVTYANSIRLNKANANILQKLAADFDSNGAIKPIDITMINSYRLGKIKGI